MRLGEVFVRRAGNKIRMQTLPSKLDETCVCQSRHGPKVSKMDELTE